MSVFRRRAAEPEPEPATLPVARDPELVVPPFRPSPAAGPARPAPAAPQPAVQPARAAPRPSEAPRRTLVVGQGISLQGTVADAERLVVEGKVESQMIQATELQIAPTGVFKGEVQVEEAEIAGVFDGTLTARGSLVVRASGRVLGTARARRLSVEEGGQISGRMEMLGEGAVPAPSAEAAPLPIEAA